MQTDPKKLELIRSLLDSAEGNVRSAKQMLAEMTGGKQESLRQKANTLNRSEDGKVVEGIFDGQQMVDSTAKTYPVPANYASKSKLVEGDTLKLTIVPDGSFIYKQIAPINRKKIIGTLTMDGDQYRVLADGKSYKILYASVTFFKGNVGDQVTLIVPQNAEAAWGAVENIIPGVKQGASQNQVESAPEAEPEQVLNITPENSDDLAKDTKKEETSDEIKPSADVQNLADEVESALEAANSTEKKPKKSAKKKTPAKETAEPAEQTKLDVEPAAAAAAAEPEVAPEPPATPESSPEEESSTESKDPSLKELDI